MHQWWQDLSWVHSVPMERRGSCPWNLNLIWEDRIKFAVHTDWFVVKERPKQVWRLPVNIQSFRLWHLLTTKCNSCIFTDKTLFACKSGKYIRTENYAILPKPPSRLSNHYFKKTDWSIELFYSTMLLSLTENIWAKCWTFLLCLKCKRTGCFCVFRVDEKVQEELESAQWVFRIYLFIFSLPQTIGTFRLFCYPAVFPAAYCFCPCHAHCLNFLCSFSVTMGIIERES